MRPRHRDDERLVVERRDREAGVGKWLGHDCRVELARAQQLEQLGGEVLLQHERHLRDALDRLAHELGQQVRADGVDHPEREQPVQRILPALRGLPDLRRLLDDRLRLAHDLLADRRHTHLVGAALEDAHVELFLELLDRHRERRLRNEAGLGGAPEMLLARHRDDVSELGQGHRSGNRWCVR